MKRSTCGLSRGSRTRAGSTRKPRAWLYSRIHASAVAEETCPPGEAARVELAQCGGRREWSSRGGVGWHARGGCRQQVDLLEHFAKALADQATHPIGTGQVACRDEILRVARQADVRPELLRVRLQVVVESGQTLRVEGVADSHQLLE